MFPPPTLLVLLRARSFDGRVITEARSSYVAWASRGFWPKRLKAQGAAVEVGKKEKGVMFEDIVSLKCLWVGKRMAAPYPPPRVLKVPSLSLKGGLVRQILCSISGIVQRSSRACALSVVSLSELNLHALVTFTHKLLVQWPPCACIVACSTTYNRSGPRGNGSCR